MSPDERLNKLSETRGIIKKYLSDLRLLLVGYDTEEE